MSFQQGLSGLNAASKNLDVIGNNIANANTAGYKASQTQFADVFANSLAGAAGTQIGVGTTVAAISQQFTQGSLSMSSNPLDLAINGQGFFRVTDGEQVAYTRNGQFHVDKDGFVTNNEGWRVTGYTANASGALNTAIPGELRIPMTGLNPQPTAAVSAAVNLDARGDVLSAAAFNMSDPATYGGSTSVAVYDSLGNPHTLSTYFVKTAPNEWSVFASNDGVQIGGGSVGTLNFMSDGSIDTAATALPFALTAASTNGAAPLAFNLDFTGSTQFGSNFGVAALAQDGYAAGRLAGFEVKADGTLLGRYTNGRTSTLAQVVLANFTNPQGLQPRGNTAWTETPDSGAPLLGVPNNGNFGTLQSSVVEDSNVDLTTELVSMITAQRFYQANAQTIKAQDQVLQTLVNLR